jgi:hypothetical protein
MNSRREDHPGYLGPAAEAQRDREQIAAKLASPKRGKVEAEDPETLALFASDMEPRFL